MKISGAGLAEFYTLNPQIASDQTIIENSGAATHTRTDPPTVFVTEIGGTAGSPVPISFDLDATAGAYMGSADILTNDSGLSGGNLDFSHTAAWGGITKVTDADGNLITGWTVTSDTGLDYTKPYVAPEPSTLVLLRIALPGLMLASRRHGAGQ